MKGYTVEEALSSERVERIARIFRNNGNPKDIQHLEWQYNSPPAGEAVTTFCVSPDNQDAAVYSVFPVSFRSSKHGYLKGSQSLDTLTDSRHRGKGAFVACAKSNYNSAIDHGIDFVYGFPNQFSAPGFFKKLGWSSVGYPPFRVFFCNFLYPFKNKFGVGLRLPNFFSKTFLAYKVRSLCNKESLAFKSSVDFESTAYEDLWSRFSQGFSLALDRCASYMNWRYKQKQDEYCFLSIYRGADLKGVCVYICKEKHGGKTGYIMDLIYEPDDTDIGFALLAQATLDLFKQKADIILCWADMKFAVNAPFRLAHYVPLPRKLQPIKLFFGVRVFSDHCDPTEFDKIYISYADSDTV